jgi:hypothetical protein
MRVKKHVAVVERGDRAGELWPIGPHPADLFAEYHDRPSRSQCVRRLARDDTPPLLAGDIARSARHNAGADTGAPLGG